MLINIHLLQNYAPSNLNRDDTGAPKDTVFGGVLRARTSSQSLKRSIRLSEQFRDEFKGKDLLAQRTRLFPFLLQQRLESRGVERKVAAAIARRAVEFGRESTKGASKDEVDSGDGAVVEVGDTSDGVSGGAASTGGLQTKQLIFLSDAELDTIADKLLQVYEREGEKSFGKIKIDEITREVGSRMPKSVDIAMFGRMTTSAAFMDVEAAVQVAHAISTHRIEQEFDYYTAVDDISGESGAGFIGDTPFNSATYYKYFNIHWEGLLKNLADDEDVARPAVAALVNAACKAHPSGKQNSFAAHNLPDLVLIEVRAQNVPVSYANAFQKPVRATTQQSLMDASAGALAEYVKRIEGVYSLKSKSAYVATFDLDGSMSGATDCGSLDELVDWLVQQISPSQGKV